MRIKLLIEEQHLDDALVVLETIGFAADPYDAAATEVGQPHVFSVYGELPEKGIPELQAVAGVLDWQVLPSEDPEEPEETGSGWPWSQNPETD